MKDEGRRIPHPSSFLLHPSALVVFVVVDALALALGLAAATSAAAAEGGVGELKLELTPTMHCLGIRVRGVSEDIVSARVEYRKAGARSWMEALPLALALGNRFADEGGGAETEAAKMTVDSAPVIRRLHGSIFWLEPDTTYEVVVTLSDADGRPHVAPPGGADRRPQGERGKLRGEVTTLPDRVVYGEGRTLRVGANQQYKTIVAALKEAGPGDTVLVTPGVYKESVRLPDWPSGEPGSPIVLRAQKGAILDGDGVEQVGGVHAGINIEDAHDIVIEGFLVRRYGYCMFFNKCRRVVIQRNYIDLTKSARGAVGSTTLSPPRGAAYGIRMKRCSDCLLQFNCAKEPAPAVRQAHDGRVLSPSKGAPGEHHYAKYPYSIDNGKRNIIRYNQMLGGACHDIITTRRNSDTDIYENVFRGRTSDDGVELEGGTCINLRFFNNLVDCRSGAKGTISTTPATVGPVYIVRNVFLCSQQVIKFANDGTAKALAAGHRLCDFAPLFFYHNVFYNPKHQFFRFRADTHGRPILVNNITWGKALPDVTRHLRADRSTTLYGRPEADWNVYWDAGRTTGSPTPGLDAHSIFADPLFVDAGRDDFRVRRRSPAVDAGRRLPNINDHAAGAGPDIGCFEVDSSWTGRTLKGPLRDDPR